MKIFSAATPRAFMAIACVLGLSASNAWADEAALQSVIDAHWAFEMERRPRFASSLGMKEYDARLGSVSVASMDEQRSAYQEFSKALKAVKRASLDTAGQLNHDLLAQVLKDEITALSFPQRMMLFTRYYGWHMGFVSLPDRHPFFIAADYETYIARLRDYGRLNAEGIATTRAAIASGMTQPCAALNNYESTISGQIVSSADLSGFYAPFRSQPSFIANKEWRALRDDARAAIDDVVVPAYQAWLDVYTAEYLPACQKNVGAAQLTDGEAYYTHRAARMTTTKLSPLEIHQIGLSQVSRIRREMLSVMDEVGFDGTLSEFQAFLREDPQFYPKTGQELLEKASFIAKKIDGALPRLFGTLPRMPYAIKAIPAELSAGNTTGYYERPAGDGTRAGVYRLNLSDLDQRPLFELEALTLHEAVPGHHLQIAIQQELGDVPNFRKYGSFTAFTEGWGLYAERLGTEIGLYQDPYANFGRLSYEMWRACRLVVDTGMHVLGWSRERAIDFMTDNTALSQTNIIAEIDRYITWPGQALGYKIGEIKLRELRAMAENGLGEAFDIRAFHDELLSAGALPLTLVEARIRDWVVAQGGTVPRERRAEKSGEGRKPDEQRGQRRRQRN